MKLKNIYLQEWKLNIFHINKMFHKILKKSLKFKKKLYLKKTKKISNLLNHRKQDIILKILVDQLTN